MKTTSKRSDSRRPSRQELAVFLERYGVPVLKAGAGNFAPWAEYERARIALFQKARA